MHGLKKNYLLHLGYQNSNKNAQELGQSKWRELAGSYYFCYPLLVLLKLLLQLCSHKPHTPIEFESECLKLRTSERNCTQIEWLTHKPFIV